MASAAVIKPSRDQQKAVKSSEKGGLRDYYVYQLDDDGNRVDPPSRIRCIDEAAAYMEAQLLFTDQDLEVWCDGQELAKIFQRSRIQLSTWKSIVALFYFLVARSVRLAGIGTHPKVNKQSIQNQPGGDDLPGDH